MEELLNGEYGMLFIVIVIGLLILYIAIAIAILQIPKIARNTKATMKITALMAMKQGVNNDTIRKELLEADKEIFIADKDFENHFG